MAFADYFDRTANAASQILEGFDLSGFKAVLNRQTIAVAIDSVAARKREGIAAADLLIRLIARFYPRIAIVALDSRARRQTQRLIRLAQAINPRIAVASELNRATVCFVIGETPVALLRRRARILYVGSEGWIARLSTEGPVSSGDTINPFGAGAAACLGAANAFRNVFAEQLPQTGRTDETIALSLLDLDPNAKQPENPTLGKVNLGQAHLVGLGAIGNGALWALARADVRGRLHCIDHDVLDIGNLQRYVMTERRDEGVPKAELSVRWLADHPALEVLPHSSTWDTYAATSDWRFELVAVALDSAAARIGVQASLPRWIVNAWTQASEIGISRHDFLGKQACMACLYLPNRASPNEDELVASALGFSTQPGHPDLIEVRKRLQLGTPTETSFLERIATTKRVQIEKLLPYVNRPLRALYVDGVCGGQVMGLTVDDRNTHAEVPMPFQSAFAGLLLAAGLVARAGACHTGKEPAVSRIDLLRPLSPVLNFPRLKDSSGRCLCQDEDFKAVYKAKYNTT